MKIALSALTCLVYSQLAFGIQIDAKLNVSGAIDAQVSGSGYLTGYEFTQSNNLRLISNYPGSSTPSKTIICEVRNLQMLSPLYSKNLEYLLEKIGSGSGTSYTENTFQCIQNISVEKLTLPNDVDTLTIVVDLANNSDLFRFIYKPGAQAINSGYTTVLSTIGPAH